MKLNELKTTFKINSIVETEINLQMTALDSIAISLTGGVVWSHIWFQISHDINKILWSQVFTNIQNQITYSSNL
jgi:hypothetical protein